MSLTYSAGFESLTVECKLCADRNKVTQVFRNMLSNALKFTKLSEVKKVEVHVSIIQRPSGESSEEMRSYLLIRVVDSGPGISQVTCTGYGSNALYLYRLTLSYTGESE